MEERREGRRLSWPAPVDACFHLGFPRESGRRNSKQNPSPCKGRQSQASPGAPHTSLLRPGQPGASWSASASSKSPGPPVPSSRTRPTQYHRAPRAAGGCARPCPATPRVLQSIAAEVGEGSSLTPETAAGFLNSCCVCVQIPPIQASGVGVVCAAVGNETTHPAVCIPSPRPCTLWTGQLNPDSRGAPRITPFGPMRVGLGNLTAFPCRP